MFFCFELKHKLIKTIFHITEIQVIWGISVGFSVVKALLIRAEEILHLIIA